MSDPEVPQNEQPTSVDDVVDSANAGLDAAAAARDEVPGALADQAASDQAADGVASDGVGADGAASAEAADQADAGQQPHVDPDLAAFEAAELDFPGTFGSMSAASSAPSDAAASDATAAGATASEAGAASAAASESVASTPEGDAPRLADAPPAYAAPAEEPETATAVYAPPAPEPAPSVADAAYAAGAAAAAETQVVPAEPAAAPQPIFVQAPEPPRELGNRGAAGAIGLLAAVCFGILYLGAILGLGALAGDVTADTLVDSLLAPLTTWAFWVPVVVFFLAFWLLGVFVNRARWGHWVIWGLLVAAAAYGGHLLGQLFQAPFWLITGAQATELIQDQLFAPLAIAAFVFARELTVWFGAWAARSGARKTALNAEARAEYERTLEAGPAAALR